MGDLIGKSVKRVEDNRLLKVKVNTPMILICQTKPSQFMCEVRMHTQI